MTMVSTENGEELPVLAITGLSLEFPGRRVVDDVSITVGRGEIVAVIGESGSGKTLTALSILGLLPRRARVATGAIRLAGRSLLELGARERRSLLGDRIAFIPQDAMRALNPTLRIGDQVGEPLVVHRASSWSKARAAAVGLLKAVHLPQPERRTGEYPHQFSGGMQQRAMIAMGLALEPELLIADEPTTALDVTVQAQVIRLLREIRDLHGTAILFIAHDLGLVADFCERVYVMYAGRIVEEGPVAAVFDHPRHPYTAALLAATPSATARVTELNAIPGQIPMAGELPRGCVFAPRCAFAQETCHEPPPLREGLPGHRLRCWYPLEDA
jgi:oligopeptide/dipeptide ABC transporter ATP-binding protein